MEKGEFIEVEYTGTVKETSFVFDTTHKEIAEKEGIFDPKMKYGPVTICLGESHLLQKLEEALLTKELGKEYIIELAPEDAFGKKDAKLLKLIPKSTFTKQKIEPHPGLQVNVDGNVGIVRTATGGRIIVDFNHPLSSKDIIYTITPLKKIIDPVAQVKAIFTLELHLTDITVLLEDSNVTITTAHALPEQIQQLVSDRITSLVKDITAVKYESKKDEAMKS